MQHHSRQRQKILDCLRATRSHPTAAWIHEQLRGEMPNLSLATVYRNLNQLKAGGYIRSVGVVDGYEHFDGTTGPHPHAVCRRCGAIVDLSPQSSFLRAIDTAEACAGFQIDEVQFSGICSDCQAHGSQQITEERTSL